MFRSAQFLRLASVRVALVGSVCASMPVLALAEKMPVLEAKVTEKTLQVDARALGVPVVFLPEPASIWIRVLGRILDMGFVGGLVGIIQMIAGTGLVALAAGAVLDLLKDVMFGQGRSVGKLLLNLEPVDASGRAASPVQLVVRNIFGSFVLGLITTGGIGAAVFAGVLGLTNDGWAIFSKRNQTLGDYLADTVVHRID